jgi:uncharacterized protein (DUF302 family)
LTIAEDRLENETDVVTKLSHQSVADTVARLTGMLSAKGIKLFAVIDQSAEARQVGLSLRETTLVIFGSPKAGTPVMVASPLAALDLPLKVLIWADGEQTKVSYYSPAALAAVLRITPAGAKARVSGLLHRRLQQPRRKSSEIVWLPAGKIASTCTNVGRLTGLPNTYTSSCRPLGRHGLTLSPGAEPATAKTSAGCCCSCRCRR